MSQPQVDTSDPFLDLMNTSYGSNHTWWWDGAGDREAALNHTWFWTGVGDRESALSFYTLLVISVAHGAIFLVGILGNLCVCLAVWGSRELRTPTNFFLLNLSVADLLLLLFCLPVYVVELWVQYPWVLGKTMCILSPFVEVLVSQASILTIMAVSVDRYRGVCRALQAQTTRRLRSTAVTIVTVWGLSLLTSSPMLVIVKFSTDYINGTAVHSCEISPSDTWKDVYAVAFTVVFFVIPLFILSLLYSLIIRRLVRRAPDETSRNSRHSQRARRRVVRMLIVVVLVFFLCMLPNRVFYLWMVFVPKEAFVSLDFGTVVKLIVFMRSLTFLNSSINPIIYSLFSTRFREAALNCFSTPASQGRHMSNSSVHTGNLSRVSLPAFNGLSRQRLAPNKAMSSTRHRLAIVELPSLKSFPVSDESDSGSVVYIRKKMSLDWGNLKETAL